MRTSTPIEKSESEAKTLSLSDNIFSNWEKPDLATPIEDFEDFGKVEINKKKVKLPVNLKPVPNIKRRRKRKKNTKTKLLETKTEKSTNMRNEIRPTKKSLYKWYHKMKTSGRFNF